MKNYHVVMITNEFRHATYVEAKNIKDAIGEIEKEGIPIDDIIAIHYTGEKDVHK